MLLYTLPYEAATWWVVEVNVKVMRRSENGEFQAFTRNWFPTGDILYSKKNFHQGWLMAFFTAWSAKF